MAVTAAASAGIDLAPGYVDPRARHTISLVLPPAPLSWEPTIADGMSAVCVASVVPGQRAARFDHAYGLWQDRRAMARVLSALCQAGEKTGGD